MEKNMNTYDITFLGHMCFDEITPYQGEAKVAPGSAVLCGAMVAARIVNKVAVVTKMAEKDNEILIPMQKLGIETFVIPAAETSFSVVIHPTANVDERRLLLQKSAGLFKQEEIPSLETKHLHLAGISDQEFDMNLILGLKSKGYDLSADMQSFVRQVDPVTREIAFKDVPAKQEIVRQMSKVKLDIVEAKVLTGTDDLEKAAMMFEKWGCPETVITQAEGVLARADGRTYYEKFSNRSVVGRTGRGDTTFAAYLSWRMEHDVAESLKFAAALVSIKMETPGPFQGTLQDVYDRLKKYHSNFEEDIEDASI
jgi:sugar/nucleoside kinase (ribokinase family)